jgi:hypothetical protein
MAGLPVADHAPALLVVTPVAPNAVTRRFLPEPGFLGGRRAALSWLQHHHRAHRPAPPAPHLSTQPRGFVQAVGEHADRAHADHGLAGGRTLDAASIRLVTFRAGPGRGSKSLADISRIRLVRMTASLERVLRVFLHDPATPRYSNDLMKAAAMPSGIWTSARCS